jgi:hypothetical protein
MQCLHAPRLTEHRLSDRSNAHPDVCYRSANVLTLPALLTVYRALGCRRATCPQWPLNEAEPHLFSGVGSCPISGGSSECKAIAISVRYQQARVGGIFFDLLPQPIDMGLERVGPHRGVISPDVVQQLPPGHHAISGTMK